MTTHLQTHLSRANTAFRSKDYKSAVVLYEEALAVSDEAIRAHIHFNLTMALRKIGRSERLKLSDVPVLLQNWAHGGTLFDENFYLENNPDVKLANVDAESHYWNVGEREGRSPNECFDPNFYLRVNADVRAAQLSPFRHYIDSGYREGRLGKSPLTDKYRQISTSTKPLLFVGHDGIQAGSEVVLLEVVRWFYENTLRRIKILLLEPGPLVNRYALYADLYVLPNYKADKPQDLEKFLSEDFQFAYLNTVVCGRFLQIISDCNIKLKAPVVAHIHEMEKVLKLYYNELDILSNYIKHWISASPATTQTLIEKHFIPSKDITTVPAFINPVADKKSVLNEHQAAARRELGLDDAPFVVMGCGTIYWRKGTDIFIETARALRHLTNRPFCFMWLGQGPDQHVLESSLSEDEKHFIKFAGNRTDANLLLAAADVFFLSSREDPFPLVVLESAQHAIPAICFASATGITAFIEHDAGVALPNISAESATKALYELMQDSHLRRRLGDRARQKLFEGYTAEKQNLKILEALNRHAGYHPAVSVIVPFYNHELYVDERMRSILSQSIKDIEIILLDDFSTDQTVEKIKPYLKDSRIRLLQNEQNSGSPFKQWAKGVAESQGDIIWIAEGDDSCDANFLSTLMPYFDDQMVKIASARTEIMDESGQANPQALMHYLEMACPGKFQQSYILDGFTEVNQQLGAMCTLVNASGLLIRRSSFGENLYKAQQFKMCGDWLIYLECLLGGKIAYDVNTRNLFRRHTSSQVHNMEGTPVYFSERYAITEYVLQNYVVSKQIVEKAFEAIDHDWARFQVKNKGRVLSEFYDKTTLQTITRYRTEKGHVAFYVHGMLFSKGGIERLVSQLANHLVEIGWRVTIYCRIHTNKVGQYPLYESIRLTPIFDEKRLDFSIESLKHALTDDRVDIFVPMLSEWLFEPIVDAAQCTGVTIIASEHNDPWKIEELWWSKERRTACFEKAHVIHLLLEKYAESLPDSLRDKIRIINNGVDIKRVNNIETQRRKVILSVGRLVGQKRFDRLIEAARLASNVIRENGYSIEIYGEGDLRSELTQKISDFCLSDIVFLKGNTDRIDDVYSGADFYILTSEFEGMPMTLIEAWSHGLPTITYYDCIGASDLNDDKGCGYIAQSTRDLACAIKKWILTGITESKRKNAINRAQKFSLNSFYSGWTDLLESQIAKSIR